MADGTPLVDTPVHFLLARTDCKQDLYSVNKKHANPAVPSFQPGHLQDQEVLYTLKGKPSGESHIPFSWQILLSYVQTEEFCGRMIESTRGGTSVTEEGLFQQITLRLNVWLQIPGGLTYNNFP